MNARTAAQRAASLTGALLGYGCLLAFLYLISVQIYRWFRQGEWTHIGVNDGLRIGLEHCCAKQASSGRLAAFLRWLDSPVDWVGMHKVFDVLPASLALFAVSIMGNCIYIYFKDRLDKR